MPPPPFTAPQPPLSGFAGLAPAFTVRAVHEHDSGDVPTARGLFATFAASVGLNAGAGADVARLPTASTCFNLLKLPVYHSRAHLKERLLYAIRSNAGFELS